MDHISNLENLTNNTKNLTEAIPTQMQGFMSFAGTVLKDGALPVKTKELVSLGIAIAVRCEGCIEAHVRNLVKAKATREEISEVISVAILMGGGPSTVYGGKALEAFDQISKL